ncbi:hypothetical protein EDD17DRAFT_1507768 [Pisolithus thermaeus]|nr:hypothetical protein EV401DRAFT_1883130 [Pisolithus croceorrhizus]KAI6162919.1 hypothetical protein EDD17DRAFT_1507768 [Pisolithus thermaeus]
MYILVKLSWYCVLTLGWGKVLLPGTELRFPNHRRGNQQTPSSLFVRSTFPPRRESPESVILPEHSPSEVVLGDVASRSVLVSKSTTQLAGVWAEERKTSLATPPSDLSSSNIGFRQEPVAEPLFHNHPPFVLFVSHPCHPTAARVRSAHVLVLHQGCLSELDPGLQRASNFGKAMEQEPKEATRAFFEAHGAKGEFRE